MPAERVSKNKKAKEKTVDDFVRLLEEYPIIGVVNMSNLPTKQLQAIRASVRKTIVLCMTKRRLLKRAIEKVKGKKPGIEQITAYMEGMSALLFTKDNPFALYKLLTKNKSTAPAKPGQIAPRDIEVKAGLTNFVPGPIIGELNSLGLKAGIEGGKVSIKEGNVVARKGDVINEKLAGLLSRLGIEPMEIGLDITAVYENGKIFPKDLLAIDEGQYKRNICQASRLAFNLAIDIAYPTDNTILFLLQKAFREAKYIGTSKVILAKEVIGDVLAMSQMQMLSIKQATGY